MRLMALMLLLLLPQLRWAQLLVLRLWECLPLQLPSLRLLSGEQSRLHGQGGAPGPFAISHVISPDATSHSAWGNFASIKGGGREQS